MQRSFDLVALSIPYLSRPEGEDAEPGFAGVGPFLMEEAAGAVGGGEEPELAGGGGEHGSQ